MLPITCQGPGIGKTAFAQQSSWYCRLALALLVPKVRDSLTRLTERNGGREKCAWELDVSSIQALLEEWFSATYIRVPLPQTLSNTTKPANVSSARKVDANTRTSTYHTAHARERLLFLVYSGIRESQRRTTTWRAFLRRKFTNLASILEYFREDEFFTDRMRRFFFHFDDSDSLLGSDSSSSASGMRSDDAEAMVNLWVTEILPAGDSCYVSTSCVNNLELLAKASAAKAHTLSMLSLSTLRPAAVEHLITSEKLLRVRRKLSGEDSSSLSFCTAMVEATGGLPALLIAILQYLHYEDEVPTKFCSSALPKEILDTLLRGSMDRDTYENDESQLWAALRESKVGEVLVPWLHSSGTQAWQRCVHQVLQQGCERHGLPLLARGMLVVDADSCVPTPSSSSTDAFLLPSTVAGAFSETYEGPMETCSVKGRWRSVDAAFRMWFLADFKGNESRADMTRLLAHTGLAASRIVSDDFDLESVSRRSNFFLLLWSNRLP